LLGRFPVPPAGLLGGVRLWSALLLACVGLLTINPTPARAANFTPGNIVIYRTGDDTTHANNGNGAPVYLDEYTTSGTLVQSIAVPTAPSGSHHRLIASGDSQTEGGITRSADGRYLVFGGLDRALGEFGNPANTTSIAVPRVIGRVNSAGSIDTTTALTDAYSTIELSGVASLDGSQFWTAGYSFDNTTAGVR
jgi:hypothetical protein